MFEERNIFNLPQIKYYNYNKKINQIYNSKHRV